MHKVNGFLVYREIATLLEKITWGWFEVARISHIIVLRTSEQFGRNLQLLNFERG